MQPVSIPACGDVVAEHLAELGLLYAQRGRAIFSRHWSLVQLDRLDTRIEAHRDALTIAGPNALALAKESLPSDETGAAAAAAGVILAIGEPTDVDALFVLFESTEGPVRHGIRWALRHAAPANVLDRLQRCAASADAFLRAAAIDVLAFHRAKPQPRINDLIVHADPGVRRLAYEAVGRYGNPWSPGVLESSLDLDEPDLRRAALETSARVASPRLIALCRKYGMRTPRPVPEALSFLGIVDGADGVAFAQNLLSHPELAPGAARALGAFGLGASVPVLLAAMKSSPAPAAAAGAFMRVTGASGVVVEPPDEETDTRFREIDPTAFDIDRAEAFWGDQKRRFAADRRYQDGLDLTSGADALDRLPLAWRRDQYLRLRFTSPTSPDIELERLRSRGILPRLAGRG
jgi:uncharacterized protein (TIGR02270 family)